MAKDPVDKDKTKSIQNKWGSNDNDSFIKFIPAHYNSSTNKYIHFRNECINKLCQETVSVEFYDELLKLIDTRDANYFEENHEFLIFIKQYVCWKSNVNQNTESLVGHLSDLFRIYSGNEEIMSQVKLITQVRLKHAKFRLYDP
jgi:hypothetical protein